MPHSLLTPPRTRNESNRSVSSTSRMPHGPPHAQDILVIPRTGVAGVSLSEFCNWLDRSLRAENTVITSMVRYTGEGSVRHRFLVLDARNGSGEFCIRLDRHPSSRNIISLSSGPLQGAKDMAKLGSTKRNILGENAKEEAQIQFPSPTPLKRLAKAIDIIRDGSALYGLRDENCWFFASIIQEISVQFLGGSFRRGRLNNPTLACNRRKAIKASVLALLPTSLTALREDLEYLALMTHDKLVHAVVMRVVQLVETQDKLLRCSRVDDSRLWRGLEAYLEQLLEECRSVVYEHIHGLSEFPGARKLRSTFSADLGHAFDEWEKSFSSPSKRSNHAMSQNDSHKFNLLVKHHLSTAFDDTENTQSHHNGLRWTQQISSSSDLELALWTIEHLSSCEALEGLSRQNRYQLKQDVIGLEATFNKLVPEKGQFACKNWSLLVCRIDGNNNKIIQALDHFIRKLLPHWIVAMGLMDEVDAACLDLYRVGNWMRASNAMKEHRIFIWHIHRFILRSKQALSRCPFHVFTGSLAFEVEPTEITSSFATIASYDAIFVSSAGTSQDSCSRGSMKRRAHLRPVCSVAYSPDNTRLASASRDKDVEVWSTRTEALLHTLRTPFPCVFVTFSPDGSQVACASESGLVCICDAKGGASIVTLRGHSKRVNSLAYSPYGTRLASASKDRNIRVWNPVDGSLFLTLQGHSDPVVSVAYSRDGSLLASASFDGSVRTWNAATGHQNTMLQVHNAVACITFHPDNERVIFACNDKSVRVWDVHKLDSPVRLEGHTGAVYSVSCSSDGAHIASASVDNTVQLWNASNSRHIRTLKGHTDEVYSVAFSPDNTQLASASRDRSIRIWDVKSFNHPDESRSLFAIAVSSNRKIAAAVSGSRDIHLFENRSSKPPTKLRGHVDSITSACFSPDDTHLATTSRDLTVRIWEVASGRCVKNILMDCGMTFGSAEGRMEAPYHMSYSTDGLVLRVLAITSETAATIYFDAQKWNAILDVPQTMNFPGTYLPERSFPVLLSQNCLCVRRRGSLAYLCWLPDDFEPMSNVLQTGRRVTVGGKHGEVVHVSFENQDPMFASCVYNVSTVSAV